MNKLELIDQIKNKRSFLCVGLDTDITKIPKHLLACDDPIFEFNKQIIDATNEFCVAYKPNTAFYEAYGMAGWKSLERTINYIKEKYPKQFSIADAKRGDIGNTSGMYAKAFFENLNFDAITVAPYMGQDSVQPFLEYKNKWTILLAHTSNIGAKDFQSLKNENEFLYETVLRKSMLWGNSNNMMYVVGATQADSLAVIRKIIPDHFLLVPGVGTQGGSLSTVAKHGINKEIGLLVNSSRAILYANTDISFAEAARDEAEKIQKEMALFI
jgi:orotidine-5'-phosphate decarboxylase